MLPTKNINTKTEQVKTKRGKDTHGNTHHKKAGAAILTLNKVDSRRRNITGE